MYEYFQHEVSYYKKRDKIHIGKKDYKQLIKFKKQFRSEKEVEFNGHSMLFSSPFWFLHSIEEIFIDEVYKFNSEKKNPFIIDCGANIGLSVLYFKHLFEDAKIVAFEADPYVFDQMQRNISKYNYQNVELINAAVWDSVTSLNFSSEGSVGGKINMKDSLESSDVLVPTTRLKDYLDKPVDFLKIDIEGAEYNVLKDCKEELINVQNLFLEYHVMQNETQTLHEMLEWIHNAGFKYYIREALNNMPFPFTSDVDGHFQMQLNIFCYRLN
ncbi:MAG: FkbM family methyltransferase [Puia sp.]